MRRLVLFLAALGLLSLLGVGLASSGLATTASPRNDDGPRCTNRAFQGDYGFTLGYGTFSPTGGPSPVGGHFAGVLTGVIDADGRGTAPGVFYINPPGTEAPDASAEGIANVLHYKVRPDCTGFARNTVNGEPASAVAFVLTDMRGGVAQAILWIEMTPGVYASGRWERIVRSDQD